LVMVTLWTRGEAGAFGLSPLLAEAPARLYSAGVPPFAPPEPAPE
jgi:hypothetical protein